MSLEIWSFLVDVSSLIVTTVLTIKIYRLERSHEKEREQMEVEARKKAVVETARVFLIDNEDEIEYLPLSVIAKSLNLKRKHHRAITTKFLRCSEEVQKEILKQANFQLIEVLFFPEGRQAVTNQRKVNKAVLRIRIRFIYLCISFKDYYRIQRNPSFRKKRGLNRTE